MANNHRNPYNPTSPISPSQSVSSTTISERSLSISNTQESTQVQAPSSFTPSVKFHPDFIPLLQHLEARLSPLVNCVTGETHPDFPATMLAYNLLTHEQCDALCRHFHQVWPPVRETAEYPVPIRPWIGSKYEARMDLDTKRRRIGQFIGLGGCESPVYEAWEDRDQNVGMDTEMDTEMEDVEMTETLEGMQQEWEEGLRRAWRDQGHRWSQK